MSSQDSVIGSYCLWRHTLFPCDHGQSILCQWAVLFMASHGQSRIRHMGHMATISPPRDHGHSRLRHWSYWFMATHTLALRSWAVKTPSKGRTVYGHTFFSPRSWAVKTLSLVRTVYGHTHSSTAIMGCKRGRTVYGHTHSSTAIMGSQNSVTGLFRHILSYPEFMGC
ncbi:hypothetical protein Bpfe_002069 [Biomphalaria pfeifferi]|uniref:Uncharacterized protein n=1 Tax=Biomphalaria pfeifferi TaxID=112525 RepID=A0AAD8FM43_BIOPF|nr:hypothetical protein Bpfe_002069 [Biomphalaria pfeifferi]